ncbi:MAG: hypothetical protein K0R09_2973 [Clostridiales bacterium]|jgi:hypothetical protein|nr:hypothetical protein [Clostridiales bacterium]
MSDVSIKNLKFNLNYYDKLSNAYIMKEIYIISQV